MEYQLDQGDVTVRDFIPMCTECDENPATKVVMVDFRSAGTTTSVGAEMCRDCADIIADRIREGLPPAEPESDQLVVPMPGIESQKLQVVIPVGYRLQNRCREYVGDSAVVRRHCILESGHSGEHE